MKKVLVAGSTGYLGKFLLQECKKRGYWIRALDRSPHKLDDLKNILMTFLLLKLPSLTPCRVYVTT